jgi:uncharacterized spore protein YtfJ
MQRFEGLIKMSLGEIERLLSTKTVVGEPIKVEGNTIVPLLSVGFGFGGGGGSGKPNKQGKGEGVGGGAGGGASIKPVAIIVVNKQGVKVMSIVGGVAFALEKVSETVGKAVEKRMEAKG